MNSFKMTEEQKLKWKDLARSFFYDIEYFKLTRCSELVAVDGEIVDEDDGRKYVRTYNTRQLHNHYTYASFDSANKMTLEVYSDNQGHGNRR